MKQVIYTVMNDYELNDLVNNTFQFDTGEYEFIADEDCVNDSYYAYRVQKGLFSTVQQDILDHWIEDPMSERDMTQLALEEMCNRGVIEPGDYLIHVSW
jgi:hypothetical protein